MNSSRRSSLLIIQNTVPSTRTPSDQRAIYALSNASTLSSNSLDAHSIFSDEPLNSNSEPSTTKSTVTPNPSSHRMFNAFAPLPVPSKQSLPVPPKKLAPPPSSQTISTYNNRRHNTQNSIMMNMSALLEEDEEDNNTTTPTKPHPHLRHTSERGRDRIRSIHPPSHANSPTTKHPPIQRRRSRSLDSASTTTPAQTQTLSQEVQALTLAPHRDLPSIGTQGYTSLHLPRAPATTTTTRAGLTLAGFSFRLPWNKLSFGADGKVDLTKAGIAQTTMATVEVVRGLSTSMFGGPGPVTGVGAAGWKVLGALGRRPSASSRSTTTTTVVEGEDSTTTSGKVKKKPMASGEGTILGFTSYRAPPSYVPAQSVLVQVWAVGVDGVDGRLVGVRFGSASGGKEAETRDDVEVEAEVEESMRGWRDTFVTTSTTTASTGRNPFVAALGRSLSVGLKKNQKGPGEKEEVERERKPSGLGRSFSLRPNKKPDISTISAPQRKHSAGGALPEKKRSGAQLHHQRSRQQQQEPSGTPPQPIPSSSSSPSKPLKLKAKSKASGLGVQQGVSNNVAETQVQRQTSSSSSASAKHAKSTAEQNGTKPLKVPDKAKVRVPSLQVGAGVPRPAEVGFIPGRSFVGRVLEVGWELGDEVVKKGEWVVGLVDVRKCGALAEFIVVDRHRIHRVPHPGKAIPKDNPSAAASPIWVGPGLTRSPPQGKEVVLDDDEEGKANAKRALKQRSASARKPVPPVPMLTLEEMALLPLCGIPAYRAVRSFMYAFSGDSSKLSPGGRGRERRRALVLRGHDGAGSMAVQMLVRRGWRVSVHVPFSCVPAEEAEEAPGRVGEAFMRCVEERARGWGAEEVIFDDGEAEDGDDGRGAAVRVLEAVRGEGDVFDAVLDMVGGREVREAGERLLRAGAGQQGGRRGVQGLFTTVVGDSPERPVPSAGDAFRANLRSFRVGSNERDREGAEAKVHGGGGGGGDAAAGVVVGYAWVSVAHEVSEWEGADVRETLGAVLAHAMEDGIRPVVEDVGGGILGRARVVPFEKAPGCFEDGARVLGDGGTVVVRIAG